MRIARNVALEMALQQRAMGRRIAQLRERAHLTQEAAADKAGVTLRAYQKWEAGGGIQYANLQKLADSLRATVEEITGSAETPSPFRIGEQLDEVRAHFQDEVDIVKTGIANILANQETILGELHRISVVPIETETAASQEHPTAPQPPAPRPTPGRTAPSHAPAARTKDQDAEDRRSRSSRRQTGTQ